MTEATHDEIALDLASRFLDCRPYDGVINFNSRCEPGHQCSYHLSEDYETSRADANRLYDALEGFMRFFQSGNDVPVTRAVIRADYVEVSAATAALLRHKELLT